MSKLENMSKEEKAAFGERKMEEMKIKNIELMKRHEEVSKDKDKAEKENSAITAVIETTSSESYKGISKYSHTEWKAERAQIDEQRIARHKDNSGTFRREWDLGKDKDLIEEEIPRSFTDNIRGSRNYFKTRGGQAQSTREWDRGKYDIQNSADSPRNSDDNWRQRGGREFRGARQGSGSDGYNWRGNNRRPYDRQSSSSDSGRFSRTINSSSDNDYNNQSGRRYSDRQGDNSFRRNNANFSRQSSSFSNQRNKDRSPYSSSVNKTNIQKEKISSGTWSDEEQSNNTKVQDQELSTEVKQGKVSSGTWSDKEQPPIKTEPMQQPKIEPSRNVEKYQKPHVSSGTWSDEEQPHINKERKETSLDVKKVQKPYISSGTWSDEEQSDNTKVQNQELSIEVKQGRLSSGTWSDEEQPPIKPEPMQQSKMESSTNFKKDQKPHVSSGTWSDEEIELGNQEIEDSPLKITFNTSNDLEREVKFNSSLVMLDKTKTDNKNDEQNAKIDSTSNNQSSIDLIKSVFGHTKDEYELLANEFT